MKLFSNFRKTKQDPVGEACLSSALYKEALRKDVKTGVIVEAKLNGAKIEFFLKEGKVANIVVEHDFSLLNAVKYSPLPKDAKDKVSSYLLANRSQNDSDRFLELVEIFPELENYFKSMYFNLAINLLSELYFKQDALEDCFSRRFEGETPLIIDMTLSDLEDTINGRSLAIKNFEKKLGISKDRSERFFVSNYFMPEETAEAIVLDCFSGGGAVQDLKEASLGFSWVEVLQSFQSLKNSETVSSEDNNEYAGYALEDLIELDKNFEKELIAIILKLDKAEEAGSRRLIHDLELSHYELCIKRRPILSAIIEIEGADSNFSSKLEALKYDYRAFDPFLPIVVLSNPFETMEESE